MFKIKKIVKILLIINLCNLPSINSNSGIDFLLSNKRKIAVAGATLYSIYKVLTNDQDFFSGRECSAYDCENRKVIILKERIHQDKNWYNYFRSFIFSTDPKKDFNDFVLKIGPQLQKTCRYAIDDNVAVHNSRIIKKWYDEEKKKNVIEYLYPYIEKAPKNQDDYWEQLRKERAEEKEKAEKDKEEKQDKGDSKTGDKVDGKESKRSSIVKQKK